MIKFNTPKSLDGRQLVDELRLSGVAIKDARNGTVVMDGSGELWLDIDAKDTAKAQQVLDAHTPKPRPEPTIEDKLASVGLSLTDLKSALGLE